MSNISTNSMLKEYASFVITERLLHFIHSHRSRKINEHRGMMEMLPSICICLGKNLAMELWQHAHDTMCMMGIFHVKVCFQLFFLTRIPAPPLQFQVDPHNIFCGDMLQYQAQGSGTEC